MLFALIWACSPDPIDGFSSTGTDTIDPDAYYPENSSDSEESSTEEEQAEGEAPFISDIMAYFVEDVENRLELHVFYQDADDDLLNGLLEITVSNTLMEESYEMAIDGELVIPEPGEISTIVDDLFSDNEGFRLECRLTDAAGNVSNTAGVDVNSAE